MAAALTCAPLLLGCGPPAERADETTAFRNLQSEYVGKDACYGCHVDKYVGYEEHGMARSVYDVTAANAVETFPSDTLYHAATDLYYRAFESEGRFFQEEFRLTDGGEKSHSLIREMDLVIGSGSAARAYATENADRYYALPMSWYAADGRWDLSPGYEGSNLRFSRPISDRCMACHNSYPETVPFVEGKFTHLPRGIGCERCHGPGALHVEARLA